MVYAEMLYFTGLSIKINHVNHYYTKRLILYNNRDIQYITRNKHP